MRRIVSVSLGSSKRDHTARLEALGEEFTIERIGTDGDMEKAVRLIKDLDGKVDAFGLGGADLYLWGGKRRYILHDVARIARAARKTPIVDGSGLKNTLERKTIEYLRDEFRMPLGGRRTLLVCAMDRFGMAEALLESGCDMRYGDFPFALGIPILLKSLKTVHRLATVIVPIVSRLPFKYLYPIGEKQEAICPRFINFYRWAEIIAGDCHYIKRYMPDDLKGKTIITNTVTRDDVEAFRRRGVEWLVTTTPEISGRSFGTNVIEALFVALIDKPFEFIAPQDYLGVLEKVGFKPRVERLIRGQCGC